MSRLARALLLLLALGAALPAAAQGRPDEESLFGGAPDGGAAPEAPLPQAVAPEQATRPGPASAPEEQRLTAPVESNAFEAGRVRDNPLQIGGQFYLRGYAQAQEHTPPSRTTLSLPTLVDVFLDARPTERLRAMVLGRMAYDPFLQTGFGGIQASTTPPANPSVALDQAWLSFDIAHRVFVTAGRQHVKWGTGHFFSPTDFLSSSRRDPLATVDTRLGVSMMRADIPWEARGWDFTAVALFEPTQQAGGLTAAGASGSTGVTGTAIQSSQGSTAGGGVLGSVGGAARAELTVQNFVFGVDGLLQRNRKSRLGLDFTTPLGPLDVYGEGLLIAGSDLARVQKRAVPDFTQSSLGQMFYTTSPFDPGHLTPGVVGGLSYTFAFEDNKSVTVAGEYFYNGQGYTAASLYPGLILNGLYQPFYTGQQYLALNASLSDPTAKTTYALSNLGNLSDSSYVVRFDFSVVALSYLTVEAFADYHYGSRGGEFRLAFSPSEVSVPAGLANAPSIPTIQAPLFDVGVGLRLAI